MSKEELLDLCDDMSLFSIRKRSGCLCPWPLSLGELISLQSVESADIWCTVKRSGDWSEVPELPDKRINSARQKSNGIGPTLHLEQASTSLPTSPSMQLHL